MTKRFAENVISGHYDNLACQHFAKAAQYAARADLATSDTKKAKLRQAARRESERAINALDTAKAAATKR